MNISYYGLILLFSFNGLHFMLFYANFLLVTLNEDATTLHVRKAIELLRGVVSTTVP